MNVTAAVESKNKAGGDEVDGVKAVALGNATTQQGSNHGAGIEHHGDKGDGTGDRPLASCGRGVAVQWRGHEGRQAVEQEANDEKRQVESHSHDQCSHQANQPGSDQHGPAAQSVRKMAGGDVSQSHGGAKRPENDADLYRASPQLLKIDGLEEQEHALPQTPQEQRGAKPTQSAIHFFPGTQTEGAALEGQLYYARRDLADAGMRRRGKSKAAAPWLGSDLLSNGIRRVRGGPSAKWKRARHRRRRTAPSHTVM